VIAFLQIAQEPAAWRVALAESRDFLMPEIILTVAACLALVLDSLVPREKRRAIAYVAIGGALASGVSLAVERALLGEAMPLLAFSRMIVVDELSIVMKAIFLAGLALSAALSIRYLDVEAEQRGEYYALMCFATVGMMLVASGNDLLSIFVAFELMALAVYLLVGFLERRPESSEASMKYFLLGTFSSGVLLYGFSLLYGMTGSTNLADIASAVGPLSRSAGAPLLVAAVVIVAAGMLVNVAAAPFHMCAPDAYEGAPTPVTAFMSIGVKAAGFALFARLFLDALPALRAVDGTAAPGWAVPLGVVAAVAMTWGNLGALTERNAKRTFGYSSIAHAGYMLLAIVAGTETGYVGLVLYLVAYLAMSLGALGALVALRTSASAGDELSDLDGLSKRSPALAFATTLALLSLAGLPPTAGFVGKVYLFYGLLEGREAWLVWLALVGVANTVLGAFCSLRFVKAIYLVDPPADAPPVRADAVAIAALALSALVTLGIGLFPGALVDISRRAVERFQTAVPVESPRVLDGDS
jgi:NADH-quinone oxidoreductase subunit N